MLLACCCPFAILVSLKDWYVFFSVFLQATTHPYVTSIPTVAAASNFNPYLNPNPIMSLVPAEAAVGTPLNVVPTQIVTTQKLPRTDRLEVRLLLHPSDWKSLEDPLLPVCSESYSSSALIPCPNLVCCILDKSLNSFIPPLIITPFTFFSFSLSLVY